MKMSLTKYTINFLFTRIQHLHNITRFSNTFTSAISLRALHPNSSLRLTHVVKPPENINGFNGYIPLDQLQISYSKSSGPGGQNVNKVNTKVDVRFHLKQATWLSNEVKNILEEKCRNRITKDGCLVFRSELTRHQQLNLADCLEKIRTLIRNCEQTKPAISEETIDAIRKRHENAAQRRLVIKRCRSEVKNDRSNNIMV